MGHTCHSIPSFNGRVMLRKDLWVSSTLRYEEDGEQTLRASKNAGVRDTTV